MDLAWPAINMMEANSTINSI